MIMECSRKGCEAILCDTRIPDVGYICYDCQQEAIKVLGEDSTIQKLQEFMKTDKYNENVVSLVGLFMYHSKD